MAQQSNMFLVEWVEPDRLAEIVNSGMEKMLVIDSRSFLEYNTCHVMNSVNVVCSKIIKRRLQQDKISVKDFLVNTCRVEADETFEVFVYDQGTNNVTELSPDCFVYILLNKLAGVFSSVSLLRGGFLEFQASYPSLCEDETRKCPSLTSLSQPCLSVNNLGPTRILPFLYLGSQNDAINRDVLKDHDITYELNVSTNCPKPDFIMDHQFMRIPVNDNYSEKLLPHFNKAFHFLDKVRQANGCVLVHCLAGISRSPTIAIAYVMRHLRVSSEEAYRYVKSKRASISPNFNFLGQLLEYEKQLQAELAKDGLLTGSLSGPSTAPPFVNGYKRQCLTDVRSGNKLTLDLPTATLTSTANNPGSGDLSPTSGLARLSFGDENIDKMNDIPPQERIQLRNDERKVSKLELTVTSNGNQREKRCVSELFLRKTTSIKDLIDEKNLIEEVSPFNFDHQTENNKNSNLELAVDEKISSSASSSADSGYEMMLDEKRFRLRRPLFPAKANRANHRESGLRKTDDPGYNSTENISKGSALQLGTTSCQTTKSSLSRLEIFSASNSVALSHQTENRQESVAVGRDNNCKDVASKNEINVCAKTKEDGLYRAQSCPGILNCFYHSPNSPAVSPLMVALRSAGSLRRKLKRNVEPCFARGMERVVGWNRYSWGNLDFGKLERLLNSDSCPDFGQITSPDNAPSGDKRVPSVIKVS
ncbi:hypothetical protein CHUAL_000244 [Chamberlinius hualienensis]